MCIVNAIKNSRAQFAFLIIGLICALVASSVNLFAVPTHTTSETDGTESKLDEETERDRPVREITAFHVSTIESLATTQDLIENGEYDQAGKKLDELELREADFTPSEKAEVKYVVAHVAQLQGNHELLVESLESILENRENISYAREAETLLRLSKIYFSQKKFEKAHERLTTWFSINEEPMASDLAFAGNLYAQIRDFKKAQRFLQQAIDMQNDAGKEVEPKWSVLLKRVERQANARN